MAQLYLIQNNTATTTAAPTKQPTGSAIRTMLQVALDATYGMNAKIVEWGCSFDGSSAATPGQVELVETGTVFATMSTACVAGDITPWGDPNATANTAGTSGVPFNLGTAKTGFATAAVTEGSITTTREFDTQLISPTNQYIKQFPLGREPQIKNGNALRIRVTFGATVNMYCYVIIEV